MRFLEELFGTVLLALGLIVFVLIADFVLRLPATFTALAQDGNAGTTTAYLSIVNSGTEDTLISLSATNTAEIAIFQGDGSHTQSGIPLNRHVRVEFAPGSAYFQLNGVSEALYEGDVLNITLNFASGRSVMVVFDVRTAPPTERINFITVEDFQITNAWVYATARTAEISSGSAYEWHLPDGFPLPPVPADNPMTVEKVELGRYLFYDPRLSGNGTTSCSSCHLQELAFTDGLVLPIGATGEIHPRNAITLTNSAYSATLTWANPNLLVLERQIPIPMFGEFPVELGITGHEDEVLDRFRQDPLYQTLFAAAYPEQTDMYTFANITRALSSFTRTLISGNSIYDRYTRGDTTALSESAQRGMTLFFSEGLECHHCHTGFNFTLSTVTANSTFQDRPFFNTGLYNLDGDGAYPPNNTGVFEITGKPEDMGRFRPPTLRNIALTAPYMHDGSIATLPEVIQFYVDGGRIITDGEFAGDGTTNPYKSGLVPGFTLTDQETADLIAFLESLTDEEFVTNPTFSDPFTGTNSASEVGD
jgi:cytochrome c peroxidase